MSCAIIWMYPSNVDCTTCRMCLLNISVDSIPLQKRPNDKKIQVKHLGHNIIAALELKTMADTRHNNKTLLR